MKMKVKSESKSQVRWFGWALLLALPMLLVTSCSKDKDEEGSDVSAITGTYIGVLTMDVEGVPMLVGSPDLTVEANGAGKVMVKTQIDLSQMSQVGLPGLDLVLDVACPANVVFANGKYDIEGSTTVSVPVMGVPLPLPVSINGTITPAVAGTTAVINITPNLAAMGMDQIQFKYTGGKFL
jgi:hypothetical protein